MATEENEYYLRTILLLCEGGGYIAKQVIARELPKHGGDLDALLKRFENSLKHEFHKKQMEKLFPNNGFDKTDIDTWDIQMLIGVMLCLFRSTLSNEEKRKLREIKLIRHEVLAHSPTAALYKQKYEDVTDQLHQAINELASQFDQRVKDKCKKFITNYSSGPLDKQSAIQRLQVAKDTDDLFQNVNKIMKNTQAVLSKGLQEVQDDVKQDLKVARKKLSSELKSSEESITGRIRDTNETMSKGFHGIETDVKESKQYVSKGLEEIKSSIGIDLKDLRKKVKDINEDTGHTFKALTDLTSQIKEMVTLENEHYLRTILLLCEGGAYIAKQIIGRELSNHGGDLDALLKQYKNKLRHEFHEKQMEKLFPNNGYDRTDVNKWDIQMLIGVMLLLFRKSLSDEEKQKMKEIKLIRHEVLAHSPSASLYLEKYEDVQKDLRDAINTLANGFDQSIKDKCKEYIKTYASEPLEVKSAIKRLQEAKDTDALFQEVITVIRKSQETLSNEIHAVESTVRQDLKETQLAFSKDLRQEVGRTKEKLTDKLNLVEDNVRQDVKTTKEKLAEQMEKIEGAECNTFQALTEVSSQIKTLQQWLVDNLKEQRNRTNEDLSSISQQLQHKAEDIEFKVRTYDETSSQPIDRGNVGIQHVSFCPERILKKKNKLLVAAIDFGTTYSGYAFSLRCHYEENPLRIVMNRSWTAGSRGLMSIKAPTAILFDPKRNFDKFGFEAEDKYSDLTEDDKHHDWFFFRRFKTFLYNKKIYRSTELEAANGNKMNAKEVFAAVIKYMKDHLIMSLAMQGVSVEKDDIHWILTVPAIWTDPAKQFMREAAYMAGIEGESLSIALEPEAASIYCQTVPFCNLKEGDEKKFEPISTGKKYIVIDLGGGTMDVTVHEKQTDGRLKEVHKASGSTAGSIKIDDEFIHMVEKIFGKEVFLLFQKEYQCDYIDLLRDFEIRKQMFTERSDGKVTIRIPRSLVDEYQQSTKQTMKEAIEESVYSGKIQFMYDKLKINADIFKSLFKPCNDMIVSHIRNLLNNEEVRGTDVFLLVGGLSQCDLLQNCLRKTFPNVQIVVPDDSSAAVLKGAVLFGHRPLAVSSRVSRYSYGLSISPLYDPSIHPENRRVIVGSTHRCRDVFMKFIACGEAVRIGDARSWELSTLWPNQQKMTINLYVSSNPNPKYVDEEETEYLGNIVVDLPGSKDDNVVVNVSMMFGETELTVEATEMTRRKRYRAYFDCL